MTDMTQVSEETLRQILAQDVNPLQVQAYVELKRRKTEDK